MTKSHDYLQAVWELHENNNAVLSPSWFLPHLQDFNAKIHPGVQDVAIDQAEFVNFVELCGRMPLDPNQTQAVERIINQESHCIIVSFSIQLIYTFCFRVLLALEKH